MVAGDSESINEVLLKIYFMELEGGVGKSSAMPT